MQYVYNSYFVIANCIIAQNTYMYLALAYICGTLLVMSACLPSERLIKWSRKICTYIFAK